MKLICSMDMRNCRDITIKDYLDCILNGNSYELYLTNTKPFRKCTADIQDFILWFDEQKFYITALCSYSTTRAIIIENRFGKKWICCSGNYSQTTTQHLHKFFKDYNVPIKSLLDIEYCTLYEI